MKLNITSILFLAAMSATTVSLAQVNSAVTKATLRCANTNTAGETDIIIEFASLKEFNHTETHMKSVVATRPTIFLGSNNSLSVQSSSEELGKTAQVSIQLPDVVEAGGGQAGMSPTFRKFQNSSLAQPESVVLDVDMSPVGSQLIAAVKLSYNGDTLKQIMVCN